MIEAQFPQLRPVRVLADLHDTDRGRPIGLMAEGTKGDQHVAGVRKHLGIAQDIAVEAGGSVLPDLLGAYASLIDPVLDVPAFRATSAANRAPSVEIAAVHRERWESSPDRCGRNVAQRFEQAFTVPVDDLVAALEWRAGARHAAARLLERFDVLAIPTTGVTVKTIGVDQIDVDGEPVFSRYRDPARQSAAGGEGVA